MIYGVVSDIHAHAWSVFSSTNSDGVNSRLRIILEELERAAQAVVKAGGDRLIFAGDLFHTRGTLDPEVLNPTRDALARILYEGVNVEGIPGNHDLKSADTQALSSAVENLKQFDATSGACLDIWNRPCIRERGGELFGFVPWRATTELMLADLEKLSKTSEAERMDVFIHAGIDGVLSGIPGSGLTSAKLASFGFRRVFAGHYHNHVVMEGGKVISIGATTHQTWSDIGTRAGFLLVDTEKDKVTFHDTMAPKFVDISGLTEEEIELEAKGNYVRFRGPSMTQDDVNTLRDQLKRWGALGTSIEVPRVTTVARSTSPAKGLSLEQSVEAYVDAATIAQGVDRAAVKKRAAEVLAATRAVTEEV